MKLEVGISTAAFYPALLTEDALLTAADLGFAVLEVFLQAETEYTAAFGRELERRRQMTGVRIHSLHLHIQYLELWSAYSRQREETRARFCRAVEIAQAVGAQALTWHGIRASEAYHHLFPVFLESALWAGEQAQAAGVRLCIENVSWSYLNTPERAATLPPLLGFTFDSFQAAESRVDPLRMLAVMGDRLTTVHLSDYAPGKPRHLPPGEGALDWAAIIRGLIAAGYTGPLLLETAHTQSAAVLQRARRFIEDHVQAAQEIVESPRLQVKS